MRLLTMFVSIPLAALFAWWGVARVSQSESADATLTYTVQRKTFKVVIQEKGELKASNSIDVKSEVDGRSTILSLVAEGSSVKKGDLLVELASDEIEERVQKEKIEVTSARASYESAERQLNILREQNASNIRKAELSLQLKELELEKYESKEGEWDQQLDDAQLRIEEAEKVYDRAKTDLDFSKKLRAKEFITQSNLDDDEFECYRAKVKLDKAERDRELLIKYTHVQALTQKQSDVKEAINELDRVRKEAENKEIEQLSKLDARKEELKLKEDRLKKSEEQMAKTKIDAPSDGLVVYGDGNSHRWRNDNQITEGADVYKSQTILQLPDTSTMKVVVRIHEAETGRIKKGQTASVEVEGISDRTYTGEVTKIAVLADSQNRWLNPELKEYETEITLQGHDERLKPGVTARVEILVAELEDVLAVPVQSVFTKGHRSFVFTGDSEDAEPTEVELGLASTEFVEIKTGVTEEQTVLLAAKDTVKHKLPEVSPSEGEKAKQTAKRSAPATEKRKEHARRGGGGGRRRGPRSG